MYLSKLYRTPVDSERTAEISLQRKDCPRGLNQQSKPASKEPCDLWCLLPAGGNTRHSYHDLKWTAILHCIFIVSLNYTLNLFIKATSCRLFPLQILFTQKSGTLVSIRQTAGGLLRLRLLKPPTTRLVDFPVWRTSLHFMAKHHTTTSTPLACRPKAYSPMSLRACQGRVATDTKKEDGKTAVE